MNQQDPVKHITYDDVSKMTAELSAPGGGQGPIAEAINSALIGEFRAKGGRIDGEVGAASDLVLITVTGAKTGLNRVIPLVYFRIAEHLIVIASMGGSDKHPAWCLNMRANPLVTVEIGAEIFPAVAVETIGPDREELFGAVCALNPIFAKYQQKTKRIIPVIELQRSV
jgi:deazaflavin-dependent oxidoreductase (nitroreductase family)